MPVIEAADRENIYFFGSSTRLNVEKCVNYIITRCKNIVDDYERAAKQYKHTNSSCNNMIAEDRLVIL